MDAPTRLRATFPDEQAARDAALALERHGVDAAHIHLSHPDPVTDREQIDGGVARRMAFRFTTGAVVAAVALGAIALVVTLLVGANALIVAFVTIAAAAFGFQAGAFYGVSSALPVNIDTLDADGGSPAGEAWIEVDGSDEVRRTARTVLEDHRPTRVDLR